MTTEPTGATPPEPADEPAPTPVRRDRVRWWALGVGGLALAVAGVGAAALLPLIESNRELAANVADLTAELQQARADADALAEQVAAFTPQDEIVYQALADLASTDADLQLQVDGVGSHIASVADDLGSGNGWSATSRLDQLEAEMGQLSSNVNTSITNIGRLDVRLRDVEQDVSTLCYTISNGSTLFAVC